MKDYYSLFIELSLQQCSGIDYADKLKVKAHNIASKKLGQLQNEMKQIDCKEILYNLLNHPDDRVKVNAASFCLQLGVWHEQAVATLNSIIDNSDDSAICFAAKMLLQGNIEK